MVPVWLRYVRKSPLKEAEKKGALVIVPVWDLSADMDKEEFFPHRKMRKDGELTNFMVVASSDSNIAVSHHLYKSNPAQLLR